MSLYDAKYMRIGTRQTHRYCKH